MNKVTIYHNPQCGTSRNTLALIRHAGIEPEVVLYLETPPDAITLNTLLQQMNVTARDVLRTNVEPYQTLNLANRHLSDKELIQLMVAHPLLINRPIVVTNKGTKLCRPSETVLELLPPMPPKVFFKEDGEQVLNEYGHLITHQR
ncbi:arsenate reductase (glutaredoxin) [Pelistega europaea]|uniref:Arsenate reductase n=1 Tax=Pelistega europaea TaxID=106147 RepID=A0A7Y4LBN6_9BURK|nr:arsenate reductase (glutaredoxin) [Pelistega europaea]NOL49596.1 arsenate reductase (glutaredoxin) [Pelistega europaea]